MAPQNISRAISVLTLGNKVILYCIVCVRARASTVTWVDRSRVQVHVHIPWNCTICLSPELYHLPPNGTVPVVSHWHCPSCLPLALYRLSPTGTVPFVSHWHCTSCLPLALYQLFPTGTPRVVSRWHLFRVVSRWTLSAKSS